MPHHKAFRFGTGAFRAGSRGELIALAHRIEDLGYAVAGNPDHFVGGHRLAPLTTLMAIADATSTLRIASTVFANDFRHPAVLATEAATLDLLSEGRLELGLGAGYRAEDFTTTGIPLHPPGVRVARLAESVQILKGLFADGPVTFAGTHYTITGLEGHPKPYQKPHPPIMIAGGGARMLSLAAHEADIVGLIPQARGPRIDLEDASTTTTARQVARVREAAGDRFHALELSTLLYGVVVTEQREPAAEELARRWDTTAEQVLDSVHFLVGTVPHMVEQVRMWRERFGISCVLVLPEYMDALAPVVGHLAGT